MDVLTIAALVAVGTVCLVPLWLRPKALVAATFLCVLFVRSATHLTGVDALANIDDGLVVLTLLRALTERVTARNVHFTARYPGALAFSGFAAFAIISALIRPAFDPSVVGSGTFLGCKAILFGWAVAQFRWDPRDIRRLAKPAAWIVAFIVVSSAVNAAMPGAWSSVFSVNGAAITRYGLPSMIGPFIHPFDLAFAASMSAVAIMAYRRYIARSRISLFLLGGTVIATFFSFRRKDLLGLIAAITILAQRFRWNGVLVTGLMVLPLAVVLAWPEIANQFQTINDSYFTAESEEARTVLTIGAWKLSTEYFPFGAGFGRYASRAAAVDYSPEYFKLGFQNVYGLGPGPTQGAFLTDTSWPAILGEAGIVGTLLFIIALVQILRRALYWERHGISPEMKWIGGTTVGWLVLTIFQSTGAAVFTSPPMFAFLLGIAGLGASLQTYEQAQSLAKPTTDNFELGDKRNERS